jgi:hypothetical protein
VAGSRRQVRRACSARCACAWGGASASPHSMRATCRNGSNGWPWPVGRGIVGRGMPRRASPAQVRRDHLVGDPGDRYLLHLSADVNDQAALARFRAGVRPPTDTCVPLQRDRALLDVASRDGELPGRRSRVSLERPHDVGGARHSVAADGAGGVGGRVHDEDERNVQLLRQSLVRSIGASGRELDEHLKRQVRAGVFQKKVGRPVAYRRVRSPMRLVDAVA